MPVQLDSLMMSKYGQKDKFLLPQSPINRHSISLGDYLVSADKRARASFFHPALTHTHKLERSKISCPQSPLAQLIHRAKANKEDQWLKSQPAACSYVGLTPLRLPPALEQWLSDSSQGQRQSTRTVNSEAVPKVTDITGSRVGSSTLRVSKTMDILVISN